MKKILSIFLSAVMLMCLFAGCKNKSEAVKTYTFTATTHANNGKQWTIRYSKSGIVTCTETARSGEDKTDFVFTGVQKGTVRVTLFHAKPGDSIQKADDVYILDLLVDRKGRVTESDPYYGAFSVDCGNAITGAEWQVSYSDQTIVHTLSRHHPLDLEGDGMQGYSTEYVFTGRRPGVVHVQIETYLPWCDLTQTEQDLWLYVDSAYRVSALEMTEFQSFRLTKQGSTAGQTVYAAQKTEDGVQLTRYTALGSWSEDAQDYVEERRNETVLNGGEDVYRHLAGLLHECKVTDWDGFHGSDPNVLDGSSFTFEAVLKDGKTISASGTNRFPDGLRALEDTLYTRMENAQ